MKGFDKDFRYTGSDNRAATYTSLDPGEYTFHVKGSNNDGIWNEKGKTITIIVIPPWWETYWFKGILLLLAVSLIFGITWFKIYSVKRINRQLEKQVFERTQKLEALLEKSPVCTKIIDLDFNLQYMSSAGIRAFKIDDITSFYGKPYPFDFYPESFNNQMIKNLQKVKATNEIIEQDGLVFDINGDPVWFHSTLVPVVDDKNQIEYIIIVSVDISDRTQAEKALQKIQKGLEDRISERTADLTKEITDRKQTEKKLIESERKHRTLFETMVQGVVYQECRWENNIGQSCCRKNFRINN